MMEIFAEGLCVIAIGVIVISLIVKAVDRLNGDE
jgi:hypothetical protein